MCDGHLRVTDMVKIAILRSGAHGFTVVFDSFFGFENDRGIDNRHQKRKNTPGKRSALGCIRG